MSNFNINTFPVGGLAPLGTRASWGYSDIKIPLRWRHNERDSVSNHQPHGCLLNGLFRRRSKKTPKLRVTGLCVGNSPGPVNSPHKGPVTRKMFPFDDVIMGSVYIRDQFHGYHYPAISTKRANIPHNRFGLPYAPSYVPLCCIAGHSYSLIESIIHQFCTVSGGDICGEME